MTIYSAFSNYKPSSLSIHRGITRFSIVRIVLAMLAVCLPVALVLVLSHQIPVKAFRVFWPPLLAAVAGVGGYIAYVRVVEKREVTELHGPAQGREFCAGLLLGTLLFTSAFGVAALASDVELVGYGNWIAFAKAITEMAFVSVIEEVVFRGVLFRLFERSLGTWLAIMLSALLFGMAHLPNEAITALAVGNTVIAGVLFAAAYLQSRRLWLPIGIHFSWNFVSDAILSLPTSGNPARGLIQLRLTGPNWLTGGAYGLEGAAVTLLLMTVVSVILTLRANRKGLFVERRDAHATHT